MRDDYDNGNNTRPPREGDPRRPANTDGRNRQPQDAGRASPYDRSERRPQEGYRSTDAYRRPAEPRRPSAQNEYDAQPARAPRESRDYARSDAGHPASGDGVRRSSATPPQRPAPRDDQYDDRGDRRTGQAYAEPFYDTLWFNLIMLVLVTPMGVFLLYKNSRFTAMSRLVASVVSFAWMFIVILLAFTKLTNNGTDATVQIKNTPSPTIAYSAGATETANTTPNPSVQPTASPVPSPTSGIIEDDPDNTANNTDPDGPDDNETNISEVETPTQYWATSGGTYYHTKKDCPGMKNAKPYTEAEAVAEGKKKCPVCMGTNSASDLTDESTVYYTSGGKSYHLDKNCQNMKNAKAHTLAEAKTAGKTQCTKCIK